MNKFLLFLSISLFVGCGEKQKSSPSIYFAGEIVNPKNDSVVLYKGEDRICASKLDANNRFSFSLDESAEEGLYNFHHKEFQSVYLEKGDSILLRVNTNDFDESLVFEGIGQEINNFLIELFLIQEHEERDVVRKFYVLEPSIFGRKIDSLNSRKMLLLNDIQAEAPLTKNAFALAKASIDYTSFLYMEKYPFRHRRSVKIDEQKQLPDNYYNYRKLIDYNNQSLTYLDAYYYFMKQHSNILTYNRCKEECPGDYDLIRNKLHFNQHKLLLIDSLVPGGLLRDNLARSAAYDYLLGNDNEENSEVFMNKFHKLFSDSKHLKEIEKLYSSLNKIRPNKPVPSITVSGFNGVNISIYDISKNNDSVVFYFWMGEYKKQLANILKRVNKLQEKNKNLTFVGISLRTDETEWKAIIEANKLNIENHFRAPNLNEINKALNINGRMNRAVITNDGQIVDAFASIYSSF